MGRVLLRYQGPPGGSPGWSPGEVRAVDASTVSMLVLRHPPGWWVLSEADEHRRGGEACR